MDRPVVDVTVLLAALVLAVAPLLPVYGLAAVGAPVAGGLVLGTAVALAGARRRWGTVVVAAVALLAYLLAGPVLAAPGAASGGLPTPESTVWLLAAVVTVWKQVLTLEPPLGATGALLAAPFLLTLLGSLLAVSVARRTRSRAAGAWAALVPVAVLVVSVLLGTKETVQPVTGGVVLTVLLLVWVAWRRGTLAPRRPLALLLVGAVLVTGGVVAGPWLGEQRPRFVLRDEVVPPFDPRDHPSPLSSFRRYAKEWKDTELLTVRGLPEGVPVRLAVMDAFDGVVWDVAGAEAADGSGTFRRVGGTVDVPVRGDAVAVATSVEIEVHRLPAVWLPTVGYTQRLEFTGPAAAEATEQLRYNDATGTAVLTGGLTPGLTWRADVVVPVVPDDDAVGAAPAGAVRLPEPRRVPEAARLFAADVVGNASTPVLVARALEESLAGRGWFSHGLVEAGDAPSLSGHGADRVTTLLTGDLMVGDHEQYASAMALMAREVGLPARVVLGFVPPEDVADSEVTVTGDDVSAWVEVAFAGHGWVPFFPTPDESRTPRDDVQQELAEPQPQVMQPPPAPPDPVRPPDDDSEQASTEDTRDDAAEPVSWRQVLLVGAAVGVPLLLLLGPPLVVVAAKARRRRRRRSAGDPVDRVVGGWEELLDQARDLRRPVPVTATRRETAVHLAGAFAAAGSGIERSRRTDRAGMRAAGLGGRVAALAAGADAMVFGPGQPAPERVADYWRQVDATVASMRGAVPRRRRWRARFSAASLRRRR